MRIPFPRAYLGKNHIRNQIILYVILLSFFLFCSNFNCDENKRILDVLGKEISTWPQAIQEIINYLSTAAFIFPILMIIW